MQGIKLYLNRNKENIYSVHSCGYVMAVYIGDLLHCSAQVMWSIAKNSLVLPF